MEFRGITPKSLLVVFLGASTYEESPNLADGGAFYNSANDLRNYLRNTYGVPRRNIKWLFDDSRSPSDQLTELARFLSERIDALRVDGSPAEDLLVYYVGHGLFAREQYCLAIRTTKENNEAFSSIRGADLAGVVKEYARLLRRFLIFDCCFSAAIYKEFQFQTPPLTIARAQVTKELPLKGTSLLCSSNADDPSLVSARLGRTMFSDALMMSLITGDVSLGNPMSFSELGDLVRENLKTKYDGSWARPEVHSPDQREGDIAQLPMFPNPAYSLANAGSEQEKQAQVISPKPEHEQGKHLTQKGLVRNSQTSDRSFKSRIISSSIVAVILIVAILSWHRFCSRTLKLQQPTVTTADSSTKGTRDFSGPVGSGSQVGESESHKQSPPAEVNPGRRAAAREPAGANLAAAKPIDSATDAETIYGIARRMGKDCDQTGPLLAQTTKQSDVDSMISVGALYWTGTCTPRDLPTAYSWFAHALRKLPHNERLENSVQKVWTQMTPSERRIAIQLSE